MLILKDASAQFITRLSQYYDYNITDEINTLPILTFKYPLDDRWTNAITEEGYICTADNDYTIKEIKKDFTEVTVTAYLNNAQFTSNHFEYLSFGTYTKNVKKKKKTVKKKYDKKDTLAAAMKLILADMAAGWTFEDNRSAKNKAKKRIFKVHKCTAWTAFKAAVKTWKFEFLIDRPNKIVKAYDKVGTDNGAYFFEELNLTNLEVQRSSTDYYTRIWPYGKKTKDGYTSIVGATDVNGNKVTTKHIDDRRFINKSKARHWTNANDDDPQDLYDDAYEELQAHCKPTISLTASVIDLSKAAAAYGALSFGIGDTVRITSPTVGVRGTYRVIKYTYYPEEPEQNVVTLCNKRSNLVDYVRKSEEASAIVNEVAGSNATTAGEVIEDGSINGNGIGEGEIDYLNVDCITATEIDTDSLVAESAFINNLSANTAFINNLTAQTAFVGALDAREISADKITSGTLDATKAHISNLSADDITTGTLDASKAHIANIDATTITSGQIDASLVAIKNLTADKISGGTLGADVVFGGTISGDKITAGTIDGATVHLVNLDASNITGGTITADRLVLRGTDKSIVYQLNSIAGATQVVSSEKINGEVITDKTITAAQIDVDNLTANTSFINNLSANTALIGQIQANVLDVNKLNALGITAGKVAAENITGTTISGKQISGGSISIGNGFAVDSNGYMTASNASISGNINAYSGSIASFNISNTALTRTFYNIGTGDSSLAVTLGDGTSENWGAGLRMIYNNPSYNNLSRTITLNHESLTIHGQQVINGVTNYSSSTLAHDQIITNGNISCEGMLTFGKSYSVTDGFDIVGNSEQGNIYLGDKNRNNSSNTNIYAGKKIVLKTKAYLSNGTTAVSSDRNLKKDIGVLDSRYVDMFDNLKPVSYKYKYGTAGRLHCGFIAQDVKEAMDKANVSDMEFAGWCKMANDDEDFPAYTDDGTKPESTYALCYEEFIPILTAKIKAQDARIEELEKQLTAK